VKDGGEPLLDRTMVLFGSGMSYGHSHSNANLPILLAGGRGLGLKHGQHVDYNRPFLKGDTRSVTTNGAKSLSAERRQGPAEQFDAHHAPEDGRAHREVRRQPRPVSEII